MPIKQLESAYVICFSVCVLLKRSSYVCNVILLYFYNPQHHRMCRYEYKNDFSFLLFGDGFPKEFITPTLTGLHIPLVSFNKEYVCYIPTLWFTPTIFPDSMHAKKGAYILIICIKGLGDELCYLPPWITIIDGAYFHKSNESYYYYIISTDIFITAFT